MYRPMKIAAWSTVAKHEDQESRQRRGHDELGAEHARHEANHRLRQPADADDAARQRILNQPGRVPRSSPVTGPETSAR